MQAQSNPPDGAPGASPRRGALGRLISGGGGRGSQWLTVLDQGLSSVGNFALVVAVARITDTDEFGAFAFSFLVYGLGLAFFRAAFGDFVLLRSRSGVSDRGAAFGGFLGVAVLLGAALALICLLIAAVSSGPLRGTMAGLGAIFVSVIVQDGYRYALIAAGQSGRAALADAVWVGIQLAGFAVTAAIGVLQSGGGLLVVWGAAAAVSVIVAERGLRVGPRISRIRPWLAAGGTRMKSLAADYLVLSGTIYASLYLVPVVASLATLAALRGAQILFAPFEVMMNGVRLITLPALANALQRSRSAFRSRATLIGAALAGLAAVWGIVVVSIPDSLGVAALGDTWAAAEPLLLAYAIGYVGAAASASAMDGVRAASGPRGIVGARLVTGLLQGGGVLIGVLAGGATGGATGFAIGMWLGFLVWAGFAQRLEAGGASDTAETAAEVFADGALGTGGSE